MLSDRQKKRLVRWIGLIVFSVALGALVLILSQDYSLWGFSNATFIPGATVLGMALLRFVVQAGMFDLVAYSFNRVRHGTKRNELTEYPTAGDYLENRKVQRLKKDRYYIPDLVVSGVLIITSLILMFI